jgi:hypothetical protein
MATAIQLGNRELRAAAAVDGSALENESLLLRHTRWAGHPDVLSTLRQAAALDCTLDLRRIE